MRSVDTRRGARHGARPALRLREERGAAMVEFALVLPLLLLLVLGILDFGRALNYWIDETQMASEGARLAAVGTCPGGDLAGYIRSRADTAELRDGSTVTISFPDGSSGRGDPVRVDVSTSFAWLPLLGFGTSTIAGSATMRLERDGGCS